MADASKNPEQTATSGSTVDGADIARFEALASEWWDPKGAMRPLHLFTPVRVDYLTQAARHAGLLHNSGRLDGLEILDIGCGGGLLAEPFARLGAHVTAIDASSEAILAAKAHANAQGLTIDYRACLSEDLASEGQKFDLIYSSEVIEHVANRAPFIGAIADMLESQGLVVITTINRTLAALATVKIGAEYITGQIPKGTHDYQRFIRPSEMAAWCRQANLTVSTLQGISYQPLNRTFHLSHDLKVNYLMHCTRFA